MTSLRSAYQEQNNALTPPTVTKKDRRKRGTHSTVCKQPFPFYFRPDNYRPAPGEIGHAYRNFVKKNKHGQPVLRRFASSDTLFVLLEKTVGRKRKFRGERKRLIDALVPLLISKVDQGTWMCTAPISTLAKELSPKDEEGKVVFETRVEVSRISRLLDAFKKYGLVEIPESQWDKEYRCMMPKYVVLTDRFWMLTGINMDKLYYERAERLRAVEDGILEPGSDESIKAARKRFNEEKARITYKSRREKIKAEKLRKHLLPKEIDERKEAMARHLMDTLPVDTLRRLSAEEFDSLVWKKLYQYELGLNHPPPSVH